MSIRFRTTSPFLVAVLLVPLVLAACGGGGGGGGAVVSPTPSPTAGGGLVSPSAAITSSGAPASPDAEESDSGSSATRSVPDDACSVVTVTDIREIFGGEVEQAESEEDENACSFIVSDAKGLIEEWAATTPQVVIVAFDDAWGSFEEARAVFGDSVQPVKGLDAEAWSAFDVIHVSLGGEDQLWVSTLFGEIYAQDIITGERYVLTKLVLGRL